MYIREFHLSESESLVRVMAASTIVIIGQSLIYYIGNEDKTSPGYR